MYGDFTVLRCNELLNLSGYMGFCGLGRRAVASSGTGLEANMDADLGAYLGLESMCQDACAALRSDLTST